MAAKKITVVISQAQGKNPTKRRLEEDLATRLLMEPGVDVSIVPNLYDMDGDHTGMLFLRSVTGPLVVLAWLYPRGIRWTLDRQGVKGQEGISLLVDDADDDDADDESDAGPVAAAGETPKRKLYCIDLRVAANPEAYLDEIRRIAAENSQQTFDLMSWVSAPAAPKNGTATSDNTAPQAESVGTNGSTPALPVISDPVKRRWYPVIDYSRCTNCMECIDFCLFGVYGIDTQGQILVESQDSCKKGCPACSRVCPENAIIFPQHKTAAIAGADGEVAGLKIDLSKLFAGEGGESALEAAVAERDAELLADGREAVGMKVGIPKRQQQVPAERDELDDLLDGLDSLDL